MTFKLPLLLIPMLALLLAAPAQAADQYCGSSQAQRAVIVIHGGSFVVGSPDNTADSCQAFAKRGFYVINLDYPLGNLQGAYRAVYQAARKARQGRRVVYAYGESAGGGLAALAAAKGWVDDAFAWAPVSNLLLWQSQAAPGTAFWQYCSDSRPATLRMLSAYYAATGASAPLRVVHGRDDLMVPISQSRALKKVYRRMRLTEVSGGHDQAAPSYLNATRDALKYFAP